MLNTLIRFSLNNRLLVLGFALFVAAYGTITARQMPVDVFPDLNRPVVTIMVEAEGYAPSEVETLIIRPLESAMMGAAGVDRVRSASQVGLGMVWVEFGFEVPVKEARQMVTEKLQPVTEQLPEGVHALISPVSSIMGEILLLGLSSPNGELSPRELRTLAEWTLRPKLLSVGGISQITVMGGGLKQLQVLMKTENLRALDLAPLQVAEAVAGASHVAAGQFLVEGDQEKLVRADGRVLHPEDLLKTPIAKLGGQSILLEQVATVREGDAPKRGDAGMNGKPAVILSIQKQPGADTLELTEKIEALLKGPLKSTLGSGVKPVILFKQATFIEKAVHNVVEALRDGSLMVALVLVLFLMNFRTTAITLVAIPLSFFTAVLVFKAFGLGMNTMTLGGLAVAIGELVDDAIVDVENVYRRLRENKSLATPRPVLEVVYEASSEVRNSIVVATIIVGLVFFPLFFLSGMEGKLFMPLGIAYLVALAASLVISLTVTPVLCSLLLKNPPAKEKGDGFFLKSLKSINLVFVKLALAHPWKVLSLAGLCFALSISALPFLGKEFLPPFNEGTILVSVITEPGTSLEKSSKIGQAAEKLILEVPEVIQVGRRTGRAENDDHVEGVHNTELDVDLKNSKRSRDAVLADIRKRLSKIEGISVNVGQPISHRLDHLMSGIRAQIAIKIFADDLGLLREKAALVEKSLKRVPGLTDLAIEKQVLVPQITVTPKREAAGKLGLSSRDIGKTVEILVGGIKVNTLLDGEVRTDLVVKGEDKLRAGAGGIRQALVPLEGGGMVPLGAVATVQDEPRPNQILRENAQRRIVVMANTQGRDLGSVVTDIQGILSTLNLKGVTVEIGGQFESQQRASRLISGLALLSLVGIYLVLVAHFGWSRLAFQIMVNVPLAMIGGVVAVIVFKLSLSLATLIGFITLCGIASRNGVMMVSHYLHLVRHEGESFSKEMIVRGTQERLAPVLMTALTAMLALIPLVLGAGEPGRELLHPIAVVIVGGLLTSTLMDQLVTPALFWLFGEKTVTVLPKNQLDSGMSSI